MKCRLILFILILWPAIAASQTPSTYLTFSASAPAAGTLNPNNGATNQSKSGSVYEQLSWTKSGTVSACTVAVDSSTDGVSWTAGGVITGQDCTASGPSAVVNVAGLTYVRINFTALSGGGTVKATYKGYTSNPAGTGGTVTSVGVTVNGGSSSGALAVTGSPVTTSGTINLGFTGTNGDVMTFGASNAPTDSGTLLSSLAPKASPTFTGTLTFPAGSASAAAVVTTGLNNTGFGSHGNSTFDFFSANNVAAAPQFNFYNWTGSVYQLGFELLTGQSGGVSQSLNLFAEANVNTIQQIALAGTAGTSAGPAVTLGGNGGANNKDFTATSGNQWGVSVGGGSAASSAQGRVTFNPSSGTANFAAFMVNPTINTTSTYSGQSRILAAYPVLTSTTGSTVYLEALGTSSAAGTGGTLTDKFTVDTSGNTVAQGSVNAVSGFQVNGAATSGNVLKGNGTNFVSSALPANMLMSVGSGTATIAGSTTSFMFAFGGYGLGAAELTREMVLPVSGVLSNMTVCISTAQPSGGDLTLTYRMGPYNGTMVSQALLVDIPTSSGVGCYSDVTHSFTYTAGQAIDIQAVNASGSTSANITSVVAAFQQ